jgi:hypothetical protein
LLCRLEWFDRFGDVFVLFRVIRGHRSLASENPEPRINTKSRKTGTRKIALEIRRFKFETVIERERSH